MPYIDKNFREAIDPALDTLIEELAKRAFHSGLMNYVFYKICLTWFDKFRGYATIKDIEGTLGCVAKEFYRNKAVPYEEEKMLENGDVKP